MKHRYALLLFVALVAAAPIALIAQKNAAQDNTAPREADSMFLASDWAHAADAYRIYLKKNATDAGAWFRMGYSLHAGEQYKNAIEAYQQARTLTPMPIATYNIACAYAKLSRADEAFQWLEKSIVEGFNQPAQLEGDDDFKQYRADARFASAMEKAKRGANPCAYLDEYKQFDFWLGDWDVMDPQGRQVGTNSVQRLAGDCGLIENWKGAMGGIGKSMNFYDAATGKWRQIWIDGRAGSTELTGTYKDGEMRFESDAKTAGGKAVRTTLTFTKLPNDRVHQVWKQTTDGGKTWTTMFDGLYIRKKG